MDRLTSMAVFVKVVELGSFAAAAAALGISAPMVGKHIRFLEARLGGRLLNRTTRRQSLTALGQEYRDRCLGVLASAEAADALGDVRSSELSGRIRIAAPALFGRRCVAPVLLDLARRHAKLEIDMLFADRFIDMAEENVDLAVRTGVLADSAGLITRRVGAQAMVACASPGWLDTHGRPSTTADLAGLDAVVYRRAGRVPPWRLPVADGSVEEVVPARCRLRLDDMASIADAAVAGHGLAWLPRWLVSDDIDAGRLEIVLPDHPPYLYDVHLVWLKSPFMPRRLRLAIDELAVRLSAVLRETIGRRRRTA